MSSLNTSILQKSSTNPASIQVVKPSIDNTASSNQVIDSSQTRTPLRQHVQMAVEQYLAELEGQLPTNLYETILQEVEKPLLQVVLNHTQDNQSKTAKILGLNRGTLRKKMSQYNLL